MKNPTAIPNKRQAQMAWEKYLSYPGDHISKDEWLLIYTEGRLDQADWEVECRSESRIDRGPVVAAEGTVPER